MKFSNKKKRLLFCAALAVALGAGIATAAHVTQAAMQSSNLVNANIEALAESESSGMSCEALCTFAPNHDCINWLSNGTTIYCYNMRAK